MEKYTLSSDGQKIHYKESGNGATALLFVHGWLGNSEWWNDQQNYFKDQYHILQMDLAGHGKSDSSRQSWTSELYADDIKAVADASDSSEIILVGHSMSGAYVLEAALKTPKVKAIVLIDTLKDLDESFTEEQAEQVMFTHYRNNFKYAVENFLPQYLFAEQTPPTVKERLQYEFLQNEPEMVINLLRPLYQTDFREIAKHIQVPVIAINSDASPVNIEANRKYLKDYNSVTIEGVGHYPMLEKPTEFNAILEDIIKRLA
ncbi:alpha/beta hydrolase [Chryseobacterium lactis]|uniref:Alpha/beta hydrolase n=1 Tax=Chryseobacterium lactis TaxID=1241981 RepID=A0A3G6RRU9_CHRLC|nr:alpha/beta hydrolase [Chryseobacterium lactis]AZA80765.1 alpha/beta hydrolase [Chryseobacterium lactis]AZB05767.1 alpha/beta hydrolase [Chryseobacterium lactis]PNW13514.1 alpha/beta hydrolase [Chryseobacterium lactis]